MQEKSDIFAKVFDLLVDNNFIRTQQDLADAVDISRPVISQLLSGKRGLTDKHIRRICRTYSFINPEWMKTGKGDMLLEDVFPIPSEEELRDLDRRAQECVEEEEYYAELERRAALYDSKVREVQDVYKRLSETNQLLSEKEAEISNLQQIILKKNASIQQLRAQIAGLMTNANAAQSSDESK